MTDRGRWLDELLLEEGASFAPTTPDLRRGVAAALVQARPASSPVRRVAFAALVVAALAFVLALAIPPARTGVAEFFGLIEGYEIEFVEASPTSTAAATPSAITAPAGATAASTAAPVATVTPEPTTGPTEITRIAEPATTEEAEAFLGAPVWFLEEQGEPEIFITTDIGDHFVILRYAELDLWQTLGIAYLGKGGIPAGSIVETPLINGRGGYWVEGVRSIRFSRNDDAEPLEVSRHSLVWRGEERVYRIETDLPLAEAVVIAETLP